MFTSVIRETLSGIVVIDLCRGQAGSVAGLLLAEAGAAVTKMELAPYLEPDVPGPLLSKYLANIDRTPRPTNN